MKKEDYISEMDLKRLLVNDYGCRCDGVDLLMPYQSSDDQPEWYKTPSGLFFPVLPSETSLGYPKDLVDSILTAAGLNIISIKNQKIISE